MSDPLATERKWTSDVTPKTSELPEPVQSDGNAAQTSPDGIEEAEEEYTGPAVDERGEVIIDYGYMEQAAAEAAHAPPILLTKDALKAYEDLGDYSITLGIEYEEET